MGSESGEAAELDELGERPCKQAGVRVMFIQRPWGAPRVDAIAAPPGVGRRHSDIKIDEPAYHSIRA
jgi:hypothetical protein